MEALNLNYQSEVFADTSQMSREEWLNTRRFGIGGSEASIIMGVSPFATKRDLFYDKTAGLYLTFLSHSGCLPRAGSLPPEPPLSP